MKVENILSAHTTNLQLSAYSEVWKYSVCTCNKFTTKCVLWSLKIFCLHHILYTMRATISLLIAACLLFSDGFAAPRGEVLRTCFIFCVKTRCQNVRLPYKCEQACFGATSDLGPDDNQRVCDDAIREFVDKRASKWQWRRLTCTKRETDNTKRICFLLVTLSIFYCVY